MQESRFSVSVTVFFPAAGSTPLVGQVVKVSLEPGAGQPHDPPIIHGS
jgi:hypothetical protein